LRRTVWSFTVWFALGVGGMQAFAWGPDGHHTVGAIADRLIAGTGAATQVQALLGGLTLQDAAVWADCAKGVDPARDYAYTSEGQYAECAIFETPEGEAEMSDFVRRNDTNCSRKPTEESCHKQYHYSDVAIQRTRYRPGLVGTRDDDLAAAVGAAMHVLRGEPAPAPFNIKDRREALLLLAHYAGDIHQPLHVGAIYLDAQGGRVDPDATGYDPATDTRGGNQIVIAVANANYRGENLHHAWDGIPAALTATHIDAKWLAQARSVAATAGPVTAWPAAWATGTLAQARIAFAGVTFGPKAGTEWPATLPANYAGTMSSVKKKQLTRAGARLAQTLRAIWP